LKEGEYSLTEKLNVAMAKEHVWRCILLVPISEISQIEITQREEFFHSSKAYEASNREVS
jgi:propanediol utilization protein